MPCCPLDPAPKNATLVPEMAGTRPIEVKVPVPFGIAVAFVATAPMPNWGARNSPKLVPALFRPPNTTFAPEMFDRYTPPDGSVKLDKLPPPPGIAVEAPATVMRGPLPALVTTP